jgi:hypothetical protein
LTGAGAAVRPALFAAGFLTFLGGVFATFFAGFFFAWAVFTEVFFARIGALAVFFAGALAFFFAAFRVGILWVQGVRFSTASAAAPRPSARSRVELCAAC